MKTINNDLIRSFSPCYDPSEKKIPDGETLSVQEWVKKYRSVVPPQDIVWLLCRNHFLSDRDLRLFAVWCAREALSLIESPDPRSVAACDVAERFVNGEASQEELVAARAAARAAANAAARAAANAANAAANAAAAYAAAAYACAARAAVARTAYSAAAAAADAAEVAAAAAAAAAADAEVAADAARATTRKKQIDKLLTYFK